MKRLSSCIFYIFKTLFWAFNALRALEDIFPPLYMPRLTTRVMFLCHLIPQKCNMKSAGYVLTESTYDLYLDFTFTESCTLVTIYNAQVR